MWGYYLVDGTNPPKIERAKIKDVTSDEVIFDDGGWNPAESTFLTRKQCEQHHGIKKLAALKQIKSEFTDLERHATQILNSVRASIGDQP